MRGLHNFRWLLVATTALSGAGACLGAFLLSPPARANPEGGRVVAGAATVASTPGNVTVNQSSQKAVIDWDRFSIGFGEITHFQQPSSAAITLNRVTSANTPSELLGRLTANGQVWLVNPSGVFIGKNATIDTSGFLATTHDISNADFLAGRYRFHATSAGPATVETEGTITINDAGLAALAAPGVANRGVIQARLGQVVLASGKGFTLDLAGDGKFNFMVTDAITEVPRAHDGSALPALVSNAGSILADGGRVLLTAAAAKGVVDRAIGMGGLIQARSVAQGANGVIELLGTADGIVEVSGTLDVSGSLPGTTGGHVTVTGEKIGLIAGARVEASGDSGGGDVRIGGDYLGGNASPQQLAETGFRPAPRPVRTAEVSYIDPDALIRADASRQGSGGQVVVWADDTTRFYGSISAQGGSGGGDGGHIETSGKRYLDARGVADAKVRGSGKSGLWLLDPPDVSITNTDNNITSTIDASGFANYSATSDAQNSTINVVSIATQLNAGTRVNIATSSSGTAAGTGSITIDSPINIAPTGSVTLDLSVGAPSGNIIFNREISSSSGELTLSISGTSGTKLSINDNINTINGTIGINVGGGVTFNGSTVSADRINIEPTRTINTGDPFNIIMNNSSIQVTEFKYFSIITANLSFSGVNSAINSSGNIAISSTNGTSINGTSLSAAGDFTIAGGMGALSLADTTLVAGSSASLSAAALRLLNSDIQASGSLTGTFALGGGNPADLNAVVDTRAITLTNSKLSIGGATSLSGTSFNMSGGNVVSGGTLTGAFTGALSLSGSGLLNGGGGVTLRAASIDVNNGRVFSAATISATASGAVTIAGADTSLRARGATRLTAGTDLMLTSTRFDGGIDLATLYGNRLTLQAGGRLTAKNTGAILLDAGQILNGTQGITLNAASVQVTEGSVLSGGNLFVVATAADIRLAGTQAVIRSLGSSILNAKTGLMITDTSLVSGTETNVDAGVLIVNDGAAIQSGTGINLSALEARLSGVVQTGDGAIRIATDRLALNATAKVGGQGRAVDVLFTSLTSGRDIRVADGAIDTATSTGFDTRLIGSVLTNVGTLNFGQLETSLAQGLVSVGDIALSGTAARLAVRGNKLSLDGQVNAGQRDIAFSTIGTINQLSSATVTARSVTLASLEGDVLLAGSVVATGGADTGFTGNDLAFTEDTPGLGVRVSAGQGRFLTLPGPGLPGGGQVVQLAAESGLLFTSRGTAIAGTIAGAVINTSVEGTHSINGIEVPVGTTPGSRYKSPPPRPSLPDGPTRMAVDSLDNQVSTAGKSNDANGTSSSAKLPLPSEGLPPPSLPALPPAQFPGHLDIDTNQVAKNFAETAGKSMVAAFDGLVTDTDISFFEKSAILDGFVQSNGADVMLNSFAEAGGHLASVASAIRGVAAGSHDLGDVRTAASGLDKEASRLLEAVALAAKKERKTQNFSGAIISLLNDQSLTNQARTAREEPPPNITEVRVAWDGSNNRYVVTGQLTGQGPYPILRLNGLWVWVGDDGRFTAQIQPLPSASNFTLQASASAKARTTQMVTITPPGATGSGERKVELASLIDDAGDLDLRLALPGMEMVATGEAEGSQAVTPSGKRVALLFANSHYRESEVPSLKTPGDDAKLIAEVLHNRFGFDTRIIADVTKSSLLDSIIAIGRELKDEDHLIIYYAGHGYSFYQSDIAFWLPVDASTKTAINWISSTDISRLLHRIPAKQILLVSDSCYSGGFADKADDRLTEQNSARLTGRRAVMAITAGGDEPVDDGTNHSPFAAALVSTLRDVADDTAPISGLFSAIRDKVADTSPQTPHFGVVSFAGYDPGADFILSRTVPSTHNNNLASPTQMSPIIHKVK